jgi:hypothetical protein
LKANLIDKNFKTTGVLPNMAKQTKLVPAARQFLKQAGGKTQLLNEFSKRLPIEFEKGKITPNVEPFVDGGAFFFFYLNQRFYFEPGNSR